MVPGYELEDAYQVAVPMLSSTRVRKAIAEGDEEFLSTALPPGVWAFLKTRPELLECYSARAS